LLLRFLDSGHFLDVASATIFATLLMKAPITVRLTQSTPGDRRTSHHARLPVKTREIRCFKVIDTLRAPAMILR
jgi:hypothetical protein